MKMLPTKLSQQVLDATADLTVLYARDCLQQYGRVIHLL